jgi:eukaryotic-like serine/threonine-protein kinase
MAEDDVTQDMPPDMPLPVPLPVGKPAGPAGRLIGGYEVRSVLGRGGMGVVYRAWQATLHREVALKMLTGHYGKDELQRFLAEAQTAAALHHANIVHIYEVGEIDDGPFFSMEFIEGGTLANKLRNGLPTARETAELLMIVARALHFAHQRGVVHRDMKPGNILIDPDGVPKVADFGIAKAPGRRECAHADRRHHRHAALHGARAGEGSEPGRRAVVGCVFAGRHHV